MTDDKQCIYDGQHGEECQCDECENFLDCFPEYDIYGYDTEQRRQ